MKMLNWMYFFQRLENDDENTVSLVIQDTSFIAQRIVFNKKYRIEKITHNDIDIKMPTDFQISSSISICYNIEKVIPSVKYGDMIKIRFVCDAEEKREPINATIFGVTSSCLKSEILIDEPSRTIANLIDKLRSKDAIIADLKSQLEKYSKGDCDET